MMKIIIGLGNPGEKYKKTRHNTGWLVLDTLASQTQNAKRKTRFSNEVRKLAPQSGASNYNLKFKTDKKLKAEIYEVMIGDKKVILAKPMTFMNNSGEAVKKIVTSYKLQVTSLYLIHDDLDIPLGKYKIQFGKGPRVHGGVESVEQALGTKDFWRVRIGIENRSQEHKNTRTQEQGRISGEEYVLQEFTREEKKIIDQVILEVGEEIKKRINLF